MSKQLQHSKYLGKNLENQWVNNIFSSHDLMCGCTDAIKHLLIILNRQGKAPKPEEEIDNIKCLITGEKDDHGEDTEDIFGDGELEQLFAEDTKEEETKDSG